MLIPIRQVVILSGGAVTLRAWPMSVADANLHDLLTLSATLGAMRDEWQDFRREDVTEDIWAAFWRLVQASLQPGSQLPKRVTWDDRLTLLMAMWELNDVEQAEGKLKALSERATRLMRRARRTQGLTMTA